MKKQNRKLFVLIFAITILFVNNAYCEESITTTKESVTGDVDMIFDEANRNYESGNYQNSIDLYNKLAHKNIKNPKLYYNLGNTYMKVNPPQLANAILYYNRALVYNKFDKAVLRNLELARSMVKSQNVMGKHSNSGLIHTILRSISYIFSLDNMTVIIVLTITSVFILISLYLLRKKQVKIYLVLAIIGCILVVFFSITLLIRYNTEVNLGKGVIMSKEAKAYKSPSESERSILLLYGGSEVKIKKFVNNKWVYISLPEGISAYVKSEDIDMVNSFMK